MSEVLPLLAPLEEIVKLAPSNTTGPSASIWDDLLALIKSTVQGIIDGASNAIKTTVNNISTTISNNLTTFVTTIKTKIDETVTGVITGVTNVIDTIIDKVNDAIGGLVDKIKDVIDAIKGIGSSIANTISGALNSIVEGIKTGIGNVIASVAGFIEDAIQTVSGWIGGVIDNLVEGFNSVKDAIREWISNAYNSLKETVTNIINTLKDTYTSLKETIEDKIQKVVDWLLDVRDKLSDWFHGITTKLADWLSTQVMPRVQSAIDGAKTLVELGQTVWGFIAAGDYQKAFDVIDGFAKGLGIPAPIKTIQAIISTVSYFYLSIQLQFVPMQVRAQKLANIALAMDPISLDTAANGVFRGNASLADYYSNASLAGVNKSRAEIAFNTARPLPTPGQIQEAFLRGEIDLPEHDKLLSGYGFDHNSLELIKSLYLLIPGPSDLIRMAVRETFTPEIAGKFGQYEDYPKEFGAWTAKQGLSEEWAKRYWAAHWDLPSATMGFEMLHRGVIENEELTLLLRALDVMPYWRERLIKISYNPLTRVDVRRMYQFGVLDETQVKRAYLDIGYDEEKATWLTEFTKRYSAPEDQTELDQFKQLARSTYSQAYKRKIISREEYTAFLTELKYHPDDIELLVTLDDFAITQDDKLFDINDIRKDMRKLILNAYNEGLIEIEEAKFMLGDLGYNDEEANLEISVIDYNRQLATRQVIVDAMHEQYSTYIIDEIQLHEVMGMFNFSGLEIDKLVETWNIERSFRTKRPGLTDLKRFYTQGLLTLDELLQELRGFGYHEKYINLYSESLKKA